MSSCRPFPFLPVLGAFLVLVSASSAQVVEEDLSLDELQQAPAVPAPVDDELQTELDAALELFASADQGASLPALGRIVDVLGQRASARALTSDEVELLSTSLEVRARARFNLGDTAGARADLAALLEARPEGDLDATQVSPRLLDLFSELRRELVGDLDLRTEPPDAHVEIDGRRIDGAGLRPFGVRAGTHVLRVSRAGFAPVEQEIRVHPGRTAEMRIELDRTGPVIRLLTRPRGATVLLDGVEVGTTEGTAPEGFLPEGAAAMFRRDEFSSELVVDGFESGLRTLEVRRDGFRPYRAELRISEPIDYVVPPIVLEDQQGLVVLRGMPPDAELIVDGSPARLDNPGAPTPQITLPPGEHHFAVRSRSGGVFDKTLRLADRQTVELDVRLRPALVFLGVLGGDRTAAARLSDTLLPELAGSATWTVLDRSEAGRSLAEEAGWTAQAWRRNGPLGPGIDWPAVRDRIGRDLPGLTYLGAVLSDDLVADRADLVVFPAAPGPATPSTTTVKIGDPADMTRVRGLFDGQARLRRPWMGFLAVDSDAAASPVVADVTSGGPADAAGLRVGSVVVTIDGRPVVNAAAVRTALDELAPGTSVELGTQGPGGTRAIRIQVASSPWLPSRRDEDLLDPVAWASLTLMQEDVGIEDRWLVQASRGLIALRARDWESAIRSLREASGPRGVAGMGQAAIDYWMGIALSRLGGGYVDQAVQLFERAAENPDARLHHNDGPWVAPLAETRLRALRGGG